MWVNVNGVWRRSLKKPYVKDGVSGLWKAGDEWVNIGGVWKQLVPPNMVVLYRHANAQGYVANGSNGTPNLLGRAIMPNTTPLQLGGASTHDGLDHGAGALTIGDVDTTRANNPIGFTDYSCSYGWHNHGGAGPSHTHGGSASNWVTNTQLVPFLGGPYIENGAIFPGRDNLVAWGANWVHDAIVYLVKMASAYLATENLDGGHTHNSSWFQTAVHNQGKYQLVPNSGSWNTRHWHNITHSPARHTANPLLNTHYWYYYNGAGKIYLNDLPSGCIAFLTTSEVPKGWSTFVPAVAEGLMAGMNRTSGSNTHSHSGSPADVVDEYQGDTAKAGQYGTSGSGEYYLPAHSHLLTNDNHAVAVSSLPPYVTLYAIIKD